MHKQHGISYFGLLLVCIALVLVAVGGMKLAPAYIEYGAVKKAVSGMMQSGELKSATVAQVRSAFDKRAQIDDIAVITGKDLDITKDGSEIVVAFAYSKKVPLFANVSVLIDFSGSSASN